MSYLIQQSVSALIPVLLLAAGAIPVLVVAHVWRWRAAKYQHRTPLTRNMLRPPGHSLSERLAEVEQDVDILLSLICFIPVLTFTIHISQSYFFRTPESLLRVAGSLFACIGIGVVCIWKSTRLMQTRRQLRAGLDGEQATGEELNQLLRHGCRVFHDIPFPYGNIDHVVISPSGVYAVETKIIGKLPAAGTEARVKVDNEAGELHFSSFTRSIPAEQLQTQAKWLRDFVRESTGLEVSVEPMLALPGWFIESRTGVSPAGIFVLNPVKAERFFVRSRKVLSEEAIQRISHQLEQRCRDVEPAYKGAKPKIAG